MFGLNSNYTPSNAGCSVDSCITTEESVKQCTACVFPFTYEGITHTECTFYGGHSKPWCGTKTDENGLYQSGNWGYCNMDRCTYELIPGEHSKPLFNRLSYSN